jgi:hypothetical protein
MAGLAQAVYGVTRDPCPVTGEQRKARRKDNPEERECAETRRGAPLPFFSEVRILKDFKCRVSEVRILNGLWAHFAEVRILKGLACVWPLRAETEGIGSADRRSGIGKRVQFGDERRFLGVDVERNPSRLRTNMQYGSREQANCQSIYLYTWYSFERGALIRMRLAEVAVLQGVGRRLIGLIRLWKSVENHGTRLRTTDRGIS